MAHVRFVIPELPPDTPAGLLFLTGGHRGWGSDPAGWTFQRRGRCAVLDAHLAEGTLLGVKVRVLRPDGQVTEEGDRWKGRAPAHKAVVHGDMEVLLDLPGWQDARQGRGRPSSSAPRARRGCWTRPGASRWSACGGRTADLGGRCPC